MTEFIKANVYLADPVKIFMRGDALPPEGFDSVLIQVEPNPRDWWFGSSGGVHLSDIRAQVEVRIVAKDELVPTYRANLPNGAHLCLLLYTGVTVPRSMPIPHGAEDWRVPFRFERVFRFAELAGFVEIQRAESSGAPGSPGSKGVVKIML